jgi:hypothetical protein
LIAMLLPHVHEATSLLQDPQSPQSSTYVEETFRFLNAPPTWVLALLVVPLSLLFVYWSYSGLTRLERPTRVTLSALRWLAVAFCCVLLFQPTFETTTFRRTRNQVHVLVDDSASMQRKDRYPAPEQQDALQQLVGPEDLGKRTREELVRTVLDREGGLLAKLRETHDVRLFRVQRKPAPIRSLEELTARGSRTALGDALDLHQAATSGANLDAVVLVSDGRNNAGLDPVEVARNYALRGIPIHTVGVGDPEPPRNAWLVGPPGPKEALCLEEVGFDVTLHAEGLNGQPARVELHGSRDGGRFVALSQRTASCPRTGRARACACSTRSRNPATGRCASRWPRCPRRARSTTTRTRASCASTTSASACSTSRRSRAGNTATSRTA